MNEKVRTMYEDLLTSYPENSPQAMMRVLAMFIFSDGDVSDEEMDAIAELNLLSMLGGDANGFAEVIVSYSDDLIAHSRDPVHIGLADGDFVDAVLAPITDPQRRKTLARALLVMAKSNGRFDEPELAVMHRTLRDWNLSLEDLAA
ncbi:MAG: TerB family tellurite resistance protein [Gammaproteobacteria bacterium]